MRVARAQSNVEQVEVAVAKSESERARCYHLRYQMFCASLGFFSGSVCAGAAESDDFDPHSVHMSAKTKTRGVVGVVRLVMPSELGLPMERYTGSVIPEHLRFTTAEVSRLVIDKERVASHNKISLDLYRKLYRAAKYYDVRYLSAAMERSLFRLLVRFGFPFEPIGPEVDYYGPVRPYLLRLSDLDEQLAARNPLLYRWFQLGDDDDFEDTPYERSLRAVEKPCPATFAGSTEAKSVAAAMH